MGLDMYLDAEIVNYGGYDYAQESSNKELRNEAYIFDALLSATFGKTRSEFKEEYPEAKVIRVSIRVGYWRKANAIHSWFVRNIQNDVDECQRSIVTREQLEDLLTSTRIVRDTVSGTEEVVDNTNTAYPTYSFPNLTIDTDTANRYLPTRGGFFFGSTDFDIGYVWDLDSTIEQLTKVLGDERFNEAVFYYQASW